MNTSSPTLRSRGTVGTMMTEHRYLYMFHTSLHVCGSVHAVRLGYSKDHCLILQVAQINICSRLRSGIKT